MADTVAEEQGQSTSEDQTTKDTLKLPPNQWTYVEALWKLKPPEDANDEMVREIPVGFAEGLYDKPSFSTIGHDARTKLTEKGVLEDVDHEGRQVRVRFLKALDELELKERRMPGKRRARRKTDAAKAGRGGRKKAATTARKAVRKTASTRRPNAAAASTTRSVKPQAAFTDLTERLKANREREADFIRDVEALQKKYPDMIHLLMAG